jgi:polysaccharide export outer membrane protein
VALSVLSASSVLADDAEKARLHYQLGQTYYEHGLYKEAEKEFQKALAILEEAVDVPSPESIEKKPSKSGVYKIGQGDILSITVWENPDLDQAVVVRPDGKVSFPLIDEVQAEGLTISELDAQITRRLKEYIRFPDVSISLQRMGGSKVIILGEVQFPDVYALTGNSTILEAIATAGGFTTDAVASSVIVVKGGPEDPRGIRVNLNKALHKPQSNQNIKLEPEDIVFVPKKFIADVNYFISQFMSPITETTGTVKGIRGWNK